MNNVSSFAEEFARRARAHQKPSVRVAKPYAEAFLGELARQGLTFAKECLDEIEDPELRKAIKAIFFCATAGAVTGAAFGSLVAGPVGAQIGVVVGASLGVVVGCAALVITARQTLGPNGPELLLSVK